VLLFAVVLFVWLVGSVASSLGVLSGTEADPITKAGAESVLATVREGSVEDLDGMEEKVLRDYETEPPGGFEDEIAATASEEVWADGESQVVGWVLPGSAETVFDGLTRGLSERGWTQVESGSATMGSFVKEDGSYRWVFLQCLAGGEETFVLVSYEREDG
jgi:hypothetical protein